MKVLRKLAQALQGLAQPRGLPETATVPMLAGSQRQHNPLKNNVPLVDAQKWYAWIRDINVENIGALRYYDRGAGASAKSVLNEEAAVCFINEVFIDAVACGALRFPGDADTSHFTFRVRKNKNSRARDGKSRTRSPALEAYMTYVAADGAKCSAARFLPDFDWRGCVSMRAQVPRLCLLRDLVAKASRSY